VCLPIRTTSEPSDQTELQSTPRTQTVQTCQPGRHAQHLFSLSRATCTRRPLPWTTSRNSTETYLASFVLRSPKVFFTDSDTGRLVLAEKNTELRCCESLSLIFIIRSVSHKRETNRERERERERDFNRFYDHSKQSSETNRSKRNFYLCIFFYPSMRLETLPCTIEDQAEVFVRTIPRTGSEMSRNQQRVHEDAR